MPSYWFGDLVLQQLKNIKFHTRALCHSLGRLAVEVSFIIGFLAIRK